MARDNSIKWKEAIEEIFSEDCKFKGANRKTRKIAISCLRVKTVREKDC